MSPFHSFPKSLVTKIDDDKNKPVTFFTVIFVILVSELIRILLEKCRNLLCCVAADFWNARVLFAHIEEFLLKRLFTGNFTVQNFKINILLVTDTELHFTSCY